MLIIISLLGMCVSGLGLALVVPLLLWIAYDNRAYYTDRLLDTIVSIEVSRTRVVTS